MENERQESSEHKNERAFNAKVAELFQESFMLRNGSEYQNSIRDERNSKYYRRLKKFDVLLVGETNKSIYP